MLEFYLFVNVKEMFKFKADNNVSIPTQFCLGSIFNAFNTKLRVSIFKGCFHYIFASLFLGINESTCQMKKNIFYST